MKEIIDKYKDVIIQIATPYGTGTGFYLKKYDFIITNNHVVEGNREVVIDGKIIEKQIAKVVFTDPKYDIAFIQAKEDLNLPSVGLSDTEKLREGDRIIAVGHPFGLKFTATQGIVSNTAHMQDDVHYIQHEAALNPGNSGGPLINLMGEIVGINTFIIRDGTNIGFSLPVNYLLDTLKDFNEKNGAIATRCSACMNIVTENEIDHSYCQFCGAKIELPSTEEVYEPVGVQKNIEDLLSQMGYDVPLSRKGPNSWEITKGSATISITYFEKKGLVVGDAYLCYLPKNNIQPIYEYLLRQNYKIENLTFSVKEQAIIISFLVYDKYLETDILAILFENLFEKADYYDDILIDDFGAVPEKNR